MEVRIDVLSHSHRRGAYKMTANPRRFVLWVINDEEFNDRSSIDRATKVWSQIDCKSLLSMDR
jgi:hypothetical protein